MYDALFSNILPRKFQSIMRLFYPYDGQVDGISADIQFSKWPGIIKGERKRHWASSILSLRLLRVAKTLQWTDDAESLRMLQLCKAIIPKLFDAHFLEAQIYQSRASLWLARNTYDMLIREAHQLLSQIVVPSLDW